MLVLHCTVLGITSSAFLRFDYTTPEDDLHSSKHICDKDVYVAVYHRIKAC